MNLLLNKVNIFVFNEADIYKKDIDCFSHIALLYG
jgi:hypothetical protein